MAAQQVTAQSVGVVQEFPQVVLAVEEGVQVQALILADQRLVASTPVVRDGKASAELELALTGNAVPVRFLLRVTARRAGTMLARAVAGLRIPSSGLVGQGRGTEVVVDLGVPRTLGGVGLVEREGGGGPALTSVQPWVGNSFDARGVWSSSSGSRNASFPEVLTERVLVTFSSTAELDDLEERMYLTLPGAPAGLELRLDGGPPVWSHPDAVEPGRGPDGAPVEGSWDAQGQRLVDLAAPLAQLLANPDDPAERTVRVTLTSRVPGLLGLDVEEAVVDRVDRVALPSADAHEIPFPEEGRVTLPLALPQVPEPGPGRRIRSVSLTVEGDPPPERVVEPVDGPVTSDVELEADPDHVFAVRLRSDHGLEALTGIRLPLAVGGDGAEARVALHEGDASGPGRTLEGGVSDPVALNPGDEAAWTTFTFPEPVPLGAVGAVWAALVPSRGLLTWPVLDLEGGGGGGSQGAGGPGPWALQQLRRRLNGDRWGELPTPFRPGGSMQGVRGRVRLVGTAPSDRPVAPLVLSLEGAPESGRPTTPVRAGTPVFVAPPSPVEPGPDREGALEIVSRARAPVTLRDVAVVWSPVALI